MANPFYLFIIPLHISLYLKAAITQILLREGKSEKKSLVSWPKNIHARKSPAILFEDQCGRHHSVLICSVAAAEPFAASWST